MNKKEKQLNDNELGALLRDIKVPSSLKSAMHSLPSQSETESVESAANRMATGRSASQGRLWLVLGIAVALLGVSAFFMVPREASKSLPQVDASKKDRNNDGGPAESNHQRETRKTDSPTIETTTAELRQRADQMMAELEITRLQARLRSLRSKQLNSNSSGLLDQRQRTSMILAMAGQSIVDLGGSRDTADANMRNIIQNYPNSKGAEIALTFLDHSNN